MRRNDTVSRGLRVRRALAITVMFAGCSMALAGCFVCTDPPEPKSTEVPLENRHALVTLLDRAAVQVRGVDPPCDRTDLDAGAALLASWDGMDTTDGFRDRALERIHELRRRFAEKCAGIETAAPATGTAAHGTTTTTPTTTTTTTTTTPSTTTVEPTTTQETPATQESPTTTEPGSGGSGTGVDPDEGGAG